MRMRIISGKLKGRYINVPKSNLIRPTTDRVRETLFNLLANMINLNNVKVLDLYAGSGSLGLECFSRGAVEVNFVEKDYTIYKNLIENIKSLDINSNCYVKKIPALKFSAMKPESGYDLILADPPFFKYDIYDVVANLYKNKFFHEKTLMVIERSIQTRDKDTENFNIEPFKIIGDTCLYRLEYH